MEENWIYLYKAKFMNIDEKEADECGIIYAHDYKDALNQIFDIYGDDLIDLDIKSKDASACLKFDPKHYAYIEALVEESPY